MKDKILISNMILNEKKEIVYLQKINNTWIVISGYENEEYFDNPQNISYITKEQLFEIDSSLNEGYFEINDKDISYYKDENGIFIQE